MSLLMFLHLHFYICRHKYIDAEIYSRLLSLYVSVSLSLSINLCKIKDYYFNIQIPKCYWNE